VSLFGRLWRDRKERDLIFVKGGLVGFLGYFKEGRRLGSKPVRIYQNRERYIMEGGNYMLRRKGFLSSHRSILSLGTTGHHI
jgi:hypothetical protein